jgi:hypothetical protein
LVRGHHTVAAELLGNCLLACGIARVYVVGYVTRDGLEGKELENILLFRRYGVKQGLSSFLADFGDVVVMDPLDPIQLDLARYVGNRGQIVTLRPKFTERTGIWDRGMLLVAY